MSFPLLSFLFIGFPFFSVFPLFVAVWPSACGCLSSRCSPLPSLVCGCLLEIRPFRSISITPFKAFSSLLRRFQAYLGLYLPLSVFATHTNSPAPAASVYQQNKHSTHACILRRRTRVTRKSVIFAGSEKRTQEDQLPTQWRAQLTVWETVY